MKDSYKFLGRRKDLVNEIKSKGITDKGVLESFLITPRHYFVDSGLEYILFHWEIKVSKIGETGVFGKPFWD